MSTKLVRWPRMIAAMIAMLSTGIIYAWAVLKLPFVNELGWGGPQLTLNYTLTLCFFCLGGIAGGRISPRIGPAWTLRLAAVLVAAGLACVSFLRKDSSMLSLYVCYAGLTGLGIGISYNVVVSATNAWYPDRRGLCTGVLMMCAGFSSMIYVKLADKLFSLPSFGWRKTFLLFGIGICVILMLCSLKTGLPHKDTPLPAIPIHKAKNKDAYTEEIDSRAMLKRASFWKFYVYSILTCAVGTTAIALSRDISLENGATIAQATTLAGTLALCNGFGRILCGLLFDGIGRRKTMLLSGCAMVVGTASLVLSTAQQMLVPCMIGLCLCGTCFGFAATTASEFISSFYGMRYFPSNYSLGNTVMFPASFASTIATVLLGISHSYLAPMIMLFWFSILAQILNFTIREP